MVDTVLQPLVTTELRTLALLVEAVGEAPQVREAFLWTLFYLFVINFVLW